MYLGVGEEEDHILVIHTSQFVQLPQVFMKAVIIISSAQFNLQTSVTTYVSCKSCKRLFSSASYSNEQRIASFLTNHAGNPAGNKAEKDVFQVYRCGSEGLTQYGPLVASGEYSLNKRTSERAGVAKVHVWGWGWGGTWVAQSVKCPTSAQVMISQSVSSSPVSGSVLTAQSLEPASDSMSPSLSAPTLLTLCLSLKNK